MSKKSLWVSIMLMVSLLIFNVQSAMAVPPIPSGFYGTVKIDGANVPNGTIISARIGGVEYENTTVLLHDGDTVYSLDVPGDDPETAGVVEGGVQGETITFFIGSIQANETATWQYGTNIPLNLTASSNHAPTAIDLSASSIAENAAANTVVGTLSTTDQDSGNSFTYTLVAGTGDTDNGAFNISGSSLRATNPFNYEVKSSYSVRIRSTDQGGLYVEQAFTITVTDVNEAPTVVSLSASSIAENAAANTTVGTLSTTDPDAGNTFTYTLVAGTGDTDNGAFSISGSSLRATNPFNYEVKSSYSVRVRSTDQGGLNIEQAFTITVTNVNEAPTVVALSASSIAENAAANTVVGTLSTTDPDSGDTFTYTLVAGTGDTDNGAFNISGSSLRATNPFNYEVKSSYSVRVRSTDQGGLYTEQAFTITVTNINEAPTVVALSASSIAENAAANTVVGSLSTTDPDAGNTFTYTLVAGTGDTDNAAFNISGSSLRATNPFNYEVQSSYTVRVRSTDQGGLYAEQAFTITVTNVNEAPVITESDPQSVTMSEDGSPVAFSLTLHASDVDSGDVLTWSISTAALHGTASASGTGGTKVIGYIPNSGYAGTDSFVVRVTDSFGITDSLTVNVTITPVTRLDMVLGWNLVSIDVHPTNTDIASVLDSIAGSYDLVYAWDAASGLWVKYAPNVGYGNTLTTLDETMGFWVRMTSLDTLVLSGTQPVATEIDLHTGWNLVGFPSGTNLPLPDALSLHGAGTDFTLVYSYHAADVADAWKRYDPATGIGNDLTDMAPGWGYWVRMSADHTWTVPY